MNNKKKNPFIKALYVTLLAVFISIILYYPLNALLPRLGIDNNNSFYIEHYYNYINKSATKTTQQKLITVINTQHFDENSARDKIADLIGAICESNPLAVGIDILFSTAKDSVIDSKLKKSIYQHSDKIVLAKARQGNTLLPSIFDNDSLNFGLINLPDYYTYKPQTEVNGEILDYFSYKIFKLTKPNQAINFKRFIVNYSQISFNSINGTAFLNASKEVQKGFIDGKIVLLGDTNNAKDYHPTPFLIQGQEWNQGIFLHAYAIQSLLDRTTAFRTLSPWLNLCICFFFCYLFTLSFVLLFDDNTIEKCPFLKKHKPTYLLLCPFFLILLDQLIFIICFRLLTLPKRIIPDVVLYMISVLLIKTFNDFVTNRINAKRL